MIIPPYDGDLNHLGSASGHSQLRHLGGARKAAGARIDDG
jgi:hypothetical protein